MLANVLLILGALAALCAILPAKYDPALRLKDWIIKKGGNHNE